MDNGETRMVFIPRDQDCDADDLMPDKIVWPHSQQNTILLREALPHDARGLHHFFFRLSADSRQAYFGVGAPATPEWAERVVALGRPAPNAYAVVAEVQGELIGIARLVMNGGYLTAEFGIIVADAWHARGVGTHLLLFLKVIARQCGLHGLTAHLLADNRRAIRMVRHVFTALEITRSGSDLDLYLPLAVAAA